MFYPTSEDITAVEVRKKEGREFILKKNMDINNHTNYKKN